MPGVEFISAGSLLQLCLAVVSRSAGPVPKAFEASVWVADLVTRGLLSDHRRVYTGILLNSGYTQSRFITLCLLLMNGIKDKMQKGQSYQTNKCYSSVTSGQD